MLLFLAGIVEQLDLALEHIAKGDVHNARFGLMLTDNALELVLHQIARDKQHYAASWRFREKPYPHDAKLKQALRRYFSDKISFARLDGGMDAQSARTFNIMHGYRNELYHAGLKHEAILLPLAQFYHAAACAYIGTYEPPAFGWGSNQKLPERARKYFTGDRMFPGTREDFPNACKTMGAASGHDDEKLIEVLADHLDEVIEHTDTCLQIAADGVYVGQQVTRDEAVLQTQAWDIAFDDAGKTFLQQQKFNGSMLEAIEVIKTKYPFPTRTDPIDRWRVAARKLRAHDNPHQALNYYHFFITQTGALRSAIEQSAAAAEAEIDSAIDRARGN